MSSASPRSFRLGRKNLSPVIHFSANYFKHTFQIGKHVDVGEPENFVTSALKKLSSPSIFFNAFHVLTTIDFNDQVLCFTTEIDDVWRHRKLPSKLGFVDLVRPNRSPQFLLRIGLVHAQASSKSSQSRGRADVDCFPLNRAHKWAPVSPRRRNREVALSVECPPKECPPKRPFAPTCS